MTNQEFVQQIERWKNLVDQAGITLSNGKPLPEKFWPVFLGYSESAYKKFKGNEADARALKTYTAKHIRVLTKLEPTVFLDEVRLTLPSFFEKHPQFK